MAKKNYAIVLREGAREALGKNIEQFILHTKGMDYFLAPEIDPNGRFFYMQILVDHPSGNREMQLHIPHEFVLYVIAAADLKVIGFV